MLANTSEDRPRLDYNLAKRKVCVSEALSIISYLSIIQTSISPGKSCQNESAWVISSLLYLVLINVLLLKGIL